VVKFVRTLLCHSSHNVLYTQLFYFYSPDGETTTTTTITAASASEKPAPTIDCLRRDVTDTRDSVRKLDLRMDALTRDVNSLAADVRTLLRALHAVLHPEDDRSRPPTSSTLSKCRPRPVRCSTCKAESSSSSLRPPTSSLIQKKRTSLVDASPDHADSRPRRPPHDPPPPTRTSKDGATGTHPRASTGGSGSSSRDSVTADDADADPASSEQTYVFGEGGSRRGAGKGGPRRGAGEWQPGVATTEAVAAARPKSRATTAVLWDNNAGVSESLTSSPSAVVSSSNSHASVLLTTDL